MATDQQNITVIPSQRVPFLDQNTGLVSREWYRYLINIFTLLGSGANSASLVDLQTAPKSITAEDIESLIQNSNQEIAPSQSVLFSDLIELGKIIESLNSAPIFDVAMIDAAMATMRTSPSIKTTDFTVLVEDSWIINDKTGSTCVATLPDPAAKIGRILRFQNYQSQLLNSASSNVVPVSGGATSNSILLASSGDSATIVSDGIVWRMTEYIPNNILLLE